MTGGLALQEPKRIEGKLLVQASGLLTLHEARYLQAFIGVHLRRRRAAAVVVDVRNCVHALTQTDWDSLADEASTDAYEIDVPVAFVVSPLVEEQCDRYCAKVAHAGLSRMAYLSEAEALEWADDCATSWPPSR
jgi:hypothetical protein